MQACGLHTQALPFSFSIPSSWGQESLVLFENLGDQCLVLVGEQLSVLRSQLAWALGVFGVAVWIVSVVSELWDPDREMGSWGFLSSETFCKWRCRGGSGPWAAGQRSAAGQPAFGTKPKKEGKYRAALSLCRPGKVVPFSTQLGHLATPCDVTGQSRSHTDRSGGPRSPSWNWVLLLPGILSSSFLPLVPQTTQQPRCTPTLSAQSHVGREETLQATRRPRRCAQAMCTLAGRLDISVNEPAAMPL